MLSVVQKLGLILEVQEIKLTPRKSRMICNLVLILRLALINVLVEEAAVKGVILPLTTGHGKVRLLLEGRGRGEVMTVGHRLIKAQAALNQIR